MEVLPVNFALRNLQSFFEGGPFVVFSDHQGIETALEKVYVHKGLSRLLRILSEYRYKICHHTRTRNVIADSVCRSLGMQFDEEISTNITIDSYLADAQLQHEYINELVNTVKMSKTIGSLVKYDKYQTEKA